MSDLNLLKSWNPKLLKNRKKVWEAQQELLEENKKIKERQKEIQKERQLEHYNNLSRDEERGKNNKKKTGLEWMYEDAKSQIADDEDFLLGKKVITDSLINQANIHDDKHQEEPKKEKKKRYYNGFQDIENKETSNHNNDLTKEDPMAKFAAAKKRQLKDIYTKQKREGLTYTKSRYNNKTYRR